MILNLIISILWAFCGLQQFMSLEGTDWSSASPQEKFMIGALFMVFGPCIMISNVILSLVDLICGGSDNDDIFKM